MLRPDLSDAYGTVRQLAIGAGKDGNLDVVNRKNMSKFTSVGNNIWQELDAQETLRHGRAAGGDVFTTNLE